MITPRTLVVPQRVRMWIEDHQRAAAKYTNVPFILGPSGVFDLHELAAEMYTQGFHDGACVGREQAQSEERARTPEEDQVIPDHLNQAREIAECAQNWGSPDARSIPYALHGNAAGTPSTAPRSDEDASRVPEGGSGPARPPESHRCDLEDGMPHRWVTGIPPVSWSLSWKMSVRELCGRHLGKRIRVDGWSGILTAVVHDHLGTDVSIEQDDGILCGCRLESDNVCKVWQ